MTAQIVILNRSAVALASDSSVTLSMGQGRLRTFPTAEKVHPLSGPHSIAVLHAGNTELLGIPYEVLLGEWDDQLASVDRLATVAAYVEHFVAWIGDQTSLWSEESRDRHLAWLARDYWLSVRAQLQTTLAERGLDDAAWDDAEVVSLTTSLCEDRLTSLLSHPSLEGWSEARVEQLLAAKEPVLREAFDFVFDDVPRTVEGDKALLAMPPAILRREESFSVDATLTFVGFGSTQLMPSVCQLEARGIIDGELVVTSRDNTEISDTLGSSILPIGMTEAVQTFLRGYDRSTFVPEALRQLDVVLDKVEGGQSTSARAERDEHYDTVREGLESLSWRTYVQPMLDTVEGLPTADLARMAESLVGLQVLRQMTQSEAETVGGPVDVAVLTRADSFRWVRHKSMG